MALASVITNADIVQPKEAIGIHCRAPDEEILFFEWLNAISYQMACRKMLFSRFNVSIEDHHLSAKIWGEKVDTARHQPAVEIKGATFTELKVARTDDGTWIAQCVVDV